MKKTFVMLLAVLLTAAFCFGMAACGEKESPDTVIDDTAEPVIEDIPDEEPADDAVIDDTKVDETIIDDTVDEPTDAPTELLEPIVEWWDLYNPNGFDTYTALITNPNDVAIDYAYDIVFYKEGVEVSRIEYCGNNNILPGKQDIVWVNYDVPASTDADDVKLETISVNTAYYTPVDGTYEYTETVDNLAYFEFTFDRQPVLANIWFVLYNDNNGNGKCDKGEIVVTSLASLTEQTGTVYFETDVHPYTDYEVYFTGY